MKKLSDMNDHDILIFLIGEIRDIKGGVRNVKKTLDNHLRHVWQIVIALVSIAGVAVTSLLIALLTK